MRRGSWITILLTSLIFLPGCTSDRTASLSHRPTGDGLGAFAGPVRLIVIDAGHGGRDPGASYWGRLEKRLALEIAEHVRDALQAQGLTVVMTREGDQFVPLHERAAAANRLRADLFVSIHLNANTNPRVSGAEVYFPSESVAAPEAHWPPYLAPADPNLPPPVIRQVLWDLVLRDTRAHAELLAWSIAEQLSVALEVSSTVKSARFVVLREAWMPAVLVEVGYLSHEEESKRLADSAYRRTAAQAIADGVLAYARRRGARTG